jgi:hypothetical protein
VDIINYLRLLSITIMFSSVLAQGSIHSQQSRVHPGQVVETKTKHPLKVDVKAWPESRESGRQGDCPQFGTAPLDSTRSGKDGRFKVKVDTKNPTYTITYCAANYVPRADSDIPNESEEVIPNPVELYPLNSNVEGYNAYIQSKTLSVLNDLAYLRGVRPAEFDQAVRSLAVEFPRGGPDVFPMLTAVVKGWGERSR